MAVHDASHWIDLLTASCAIDSRTIAGAAGTTRVAELFGQSLTAMGFSLHWHEASLPDQPRGRHLHAVRNPDGAKRLVFIGHTDTVLSPEDVPMRREGDRLQASGACDMKGGCVIMLAAIQAALQDSKFVRDARLDVLLNASEEIAGPSFRVLARKVAQGAAACLSFEPPDPEEKLLHRVVISRKGVVRCELTVTGRASHAGIAHAYGVNAIHELGCKIAALHEVTDYAKDLTLNVGLIRGGKAINQVADEAVAGINMRAFDPQVLEEGLKRVRKICSESTVSSPIDGATTKLSLSEYVSYPAWPAYASSVTLAQQYVDIAKKQGIEVTMISSGGGADASHVADLTPTIDGLGILGGGMHQRDEWAHLPSMALRAKLTAQLITQLCE